MPVVVLQTGLNAETAVAPAPSATQVYPVAGDTGWLDATAFAPGSSLVAQGLNAGDAVELRISNKPYGPPRVAGGPLFFIAAPPRPPAGGGIGGVYDSPISAGSDDA